MRLSQLNGLILIHKYGSISKAAQESFLSQSALSVAIKELEEELGNVILIRTKKGVAFTPYGLQVLEHAQRIFSEVEMIRELEGQQSTVHGNIALGTSSYFSNIMATNSLVQLKETFPGIHLTIHQDKNVNVIGDVLLGHLDLGLLQIGVLHEVLCYPQELLKSKLEFHPLLIRPMQIVVGESHPLREKTVLRLADLCAYPYITNKNLDEDMFYQQLKEQGHPSEVIQVNDTVTRSLVVSMNGFNVVIDLGLEAGNQHYQEKLYPLQVEDFSGGYAVGWIHKAHPLSLAEEKLVELLKQQAIAYSEEKNG